MLHEAMRRNEVIKVQYVPFQPVTCLDSMLGMITNGLLWGPYLYICGHACATVSRCTLDLFGCRGNNVREAGLAVEPSAVVSACVRSGLTCTQTRRCAVWCCPSESVWGSCTCPVRLSCSQRGWRRWPFSCSHPERWPTLSSKPGNTVGEQPRQIGQTSARAANFVWQTNLQYFYFLVNTTCEVNGNLSFCFQICQSHSKSLLICPHLSASCYLGHTVCWSRRVFFCFLSHRVTFQREVWGEKTDAEK